MKIYSKTKDYMLLDGSMLEMEEFIEPNSITSIVTDPPYGLTSIIKRFGKENSAPAQYGKDGFFSRLSKGFMGKAWDGSGIEYNIETWQKCYNVLKPGGYLLAFGGSRTYHRMACAIEDAGFEIRDCIMWIYGCYSADTQVLTNKGWKYFYELDKTEKILQWDKDTNKLFWIKPLNYFEYDIYDEMILLENRHTSQLLSKNHKVIAKIQRNERKQVNGVRKIISKKGNYEIIEAQDLDKRWNISLPIASNLDGEIDCKYPYMLGWWLTDAYKHKDGKACMFTQSKHKTLQKLKAELDRLKELGECNYSEYIKDDGNINHKPEHIFYVTGKLADYLLTNYNNREMTWDLLNFNLTSKKELLQGLIDGDGSVRKGSYSKTFWTKKQIRKDIMSALLTTMNYRNYIVEDGVVFNVEHNSTEISYKHRKPLQKYKGKIYCLETETGAFVVRRNGKPFISGNSGFPKSMNIGLAIDKRNGVDNRTGKILNGTHSHNIVYNSGHNREFEERHATNDWKGWGTTLKPAYEPIIVARKPFNGSLVDNIIENGVGGINIDECRVPTAEKDLEKLNSEWDREWNTNYNNFSEKIGGQSGFDYSNSRVENKGLTGRFPANIIHDGSEEATAGMPYTNSSKQIIGGANRKAYEQKEIVNPCGWKESNRIRKTEGYNDDGGSASRYFYCAKASKKDRDEGLDEFKNVSGASITNRKEGSAGLVMQDGKQNPFAGKASPNNKNTHPTVKPTELMQYLVRLVTPKGGIILDPFMGSGSTAKAVMFENKERNADYKFIGVELTEEYLPIAKARIEFAYGYVEEEDKSTEKVPRTKKNY